MDSVNYRCGEFQIDASNRRFSRAGAEVPVEPKVFAVVLQLLAKHGELVTRDQLLDAVWGHRFVTPSTLNRVIALARRAFADDAEQPKFIQTVHGAGYRYAGPVETAQAIPPEVRARFAPPPTARLPALLQALIGRECEIKQMRTLLAGARALTVVGAGGMGKTQCTLAFAHELSESFPDGVWFFDLVPVQRAHDWLQSLALALSIPALAEHELPVRVCQALAGRRALLLLDNCDHISAGVGELVHEILRATEHIKVLATSQRTLNFVGERVLQMPPLALPALRRPGGATDVQEISAAPAVSLFLARIQAAQPGFSLTADNAPTIVEICERLDGMPLALELAAARFTLLSPDQVLERLDSRFRFLVSNVTGRDARHRNLTALLEWSFSLLSTDEQRFLSWLGVFVQGWNVDAAIELAAPLGHDPETAVDLLTGLASKSLVTVDQSVSPPRYRLLESVRDFALARLASLGDEQRAREAHLAFVVKMTLAAQRDMLGGRMRERNTMLAQEEGNIDSAMNHALSSPQTGNAALSIAAALALYFKSQGGYRMAIRQLPRALAMPAATETIERGRTYMCLGVVAVHMRRADLPPGEALANALRIARARGDRWCEGYASGYLAMWLIDTGRADEAREPIATTAAIAQELDDDLLRGLAGIARAWDHMARGANAEAIAVLQAVSDLGSDYHQHHFISMYIGLASFALGDRVVAATKWLEAMNVGLAVRNIRGAAGAVEGCSYMSAKFQHFDDASIFLGAAARIREQTGVPMFSFWVPHHDQTTAALRAAMGDSQFEATLATGMQMRAEDVINRAAARLREYQGPAG